MSLDNFQELKKDYVSLLIKTLVHLLLVISRCIYMIY